MNVAAAISVASALCVLGGCEIVGIQTRVVYEDPVNFVRLEPDPHVFEELPATQHRHPFTLDPERMIDALKGLSVREHRNTLQRLISGEAPREPVFREEEIRFLSSKLTEALAQAHPNERVTFYLSKPQTSIKREITSGGLYVHDHALHFILGNHRITYGIPAYGMVYDRRHPTMPISPKGFDLFFDPPGAVIKQKSGLISRLLGKEKDELVIDLGKLIHAGPATIGFTEPATLAQRVTSGPPHTLRSLQQSYTRTAPRRGGFEPPSTPPPSA